MTIAARLRRQPPADADAHMVFVRTLSMPPGLPWRQAQAAALEARVGAPLPLSEVIYRLKRLDPWRPAQPSRFAACYLKAQDAGKSLSTDVWVDGRAIRLQFLSTAERLEQSRRLGVIAAITVATILSLGLAVGAALNVRADTSDRLDAAQGRLQVKLRVLSAESRERHDAAQLDAAGVRRQSLNDFLRDLSWVGAAKDPAAHFDALHWEKGYVGVEVRGEAHPFTVVDRPVVRAAKPLRPGVWLWGVAPPSESSRDGGRTHPSGSGARS